MKTDVSAPCVCTEGDTNQVLASPPGLKASGKSPVGCRHRVARVVRRAASGADTGSNGMPNGSFADTLDVVFKR
jgi:hypothetical protein